MPTVHPSITDKLKGLPAKPGCYIYRDEKEEVLYVGKALSLRSRVRSYFQDSARHGPRIERLVSRVRDIETIVVESEVEALVLECNLIKRYRPPFNVRMRDDKSYPYITITKEPFPRVLFTRKVRKDGAKYFGPFTSAYSVRETLQLLHKIFPLIPCGKSWRGAAEQRPCLYFHLGQCLAPCAGLSEKKAYDQVIEQVERFLSGKEESLMKDIRNEMAAASEAMDYERAAILRDRLIAVDNVLQRQKVLDADGRDRDVIAVVKDERGAAIQMLYVRSGKLIGQRQFFLDGSKESSPSESVQEFVKQYYNDAPDLPNEILLPIEIEERQIVQQWLRGRKGRAVSISVPQGGEKLKLIEMAMDNAELALQEMRDETERADQWSEEAMSQLQEALGLPTLPMRVEGYDISNVQGTAPVGSMVVFEKAQAAKAEYRRFRVKFQPESPNDFAMMHEVILRRFRRYLDGDPKFIKLPDLVMIDGGKGQLAAAIKARDELGMAVPMIGLAKKLELIYIPKRDEFGFEEIELPMQAPALVLLRRLRDEAHRFALTFHRKVRDKRMTGSILEEIPGVGPRRRRLLLRNFGSVEGIRRASVDELAAVPTMTRRLAEQINEILNEP
ncbi:MAG: UvrABC system protein C [Fimbriimonadaceae bacterium]|nr:UvrABC system protein C [Fimbriimonadaceae bacterium]